MTHTRSAGTEHVSHLLRGVALVLGGRAGWMGFFLNVIIYILSVMSADQEIDV